MDTVADFLTRIRNAGMARHEKVDVPSSNLRVGLAKILEENGYIRSYKVARDGKQGLMRLYLKYNQEGHHVITKVNRVSTPGRRRYLGAADIKSTRNGYGMSILSTNKGILSDSTARKENVGGEVLCEIW